MQRLVLIVAVASLLCVPAATAIRLRREVKSTGEEANHDDERYLKTQYHALELEVRQLMRVARIPVAGLLQLATDLPKANGTVAKAAPAKEVNLANASAQHNVTNVASKSLGLPAGLAEKLPSNVLNAVAGASGAGQAAMGKVMLAPMLEMLKGLYGDQKTRIGELNKREQKSKERFDRQQKEFDTKIAHITELHNSHKLSDEFFKNETSDSTRMFTYWKHSRERNHQQFHTSLKLTHATMAKEKQMIKAYEIALDDKPSSQAEGKKEFAKIKKEVLPEIVFLQGDGLLSFCSTMLSDVASSLGNLEKTSD